MSKLILPRRKLIAGLAAGLVCAPAIVRAGTIPLLGAGKAPGGGGAKGLQTNLGSFFSLDNTLADATSNVTNLTNNNTVTFVSSSPTPIAAVTNSAKFVQASSQYLSHADATGLNVAGIDFSVQVWIYPAGATMFLVSKEAGGFGSREYSLQRTFATGTNDPFRAVINSGSGTTINTANYLPNVWHHLVLTYNATTKAVILYVDGVSAATGTSASNPAGTSLLTIGADGGPGNFAEGNMCLFGTWRNRILTPADVTALYNGGAGLSYAGML